MFPSSSSHLFRKAFGSPHLSTLSCRSFSTSNPQLNLTRLDSGLRVVSEEKSGDLAVLGVTIEAGISHQKEDNGVATAVGQALSQNSQLVATSLGLAGKFNTYTTRDRTVLTLACLKSEVPRAVEQLSGIVQNLYSLGQEQYLFSARFRDNILAAKRNEHSIVTEHLYSIAFHGHPMSFSPVGNKKASEADYAKFVKDNITAPRTILSGVGVTHEQLVQLAKKDFSDLPTLAGASPIVPRYIGAKADIRDDFLNDVHITFAVQAPSRSSPSYLTARVIQAILGDWDVSQGVGNNTTSRLAETAALEHLATKVSAFYDAHQTTGLLGVYSVASPHEIEDFSVEVLTEFVRISQKVSNAEVERAKERVKHEILASVSTSPALVETISEQVFYHARRTSVGELLESLQKITRNDVQKLAEEILYDVDPVVSAHGPTTHLPDYNRLRSWIYWNRL